MAQDDNFISNGPKIDKTSKAIYKREPSQRLVI